MRVIVVGAGIGGLTLAHGLRRAGVEVAVYERDGARGRPQGVSLHCDDRGLSALRACLPPAHLAMVEATMGGPRTQTLVLDGDLAVIGVRPSDGTGPARPGRQVHRPLLRSVLLTGLGDVVHFGAEFTRFALRADGAVQAWFADGSVATADVLVGADGVGSAVRRQLLPDVEVIDTGRRMLMGATPLRAAPGLADVIGDSPGVLRVDGSTMALGILRFTESPVAARDRWLPALRFDAIEDYVMWALPPGSEPPAVLRRVIDRAWQELTVCLRIGMIPPMPAWPAGPVTVIGDAIHLAPGFGGNLAMQDAHRLCAALAAGPDLVDAIGGYEREMRAANWCVR